MSSLLYFKQSTAEVLQLESGRESRVTLPAENRIAIFVSVGYVTVFEFTLKYLCDYARTLRGKSCGGEGFDGRALMARNRCVLFPWTNSG